MQALGALLSAGSKLHALPLRQADACRRASMCRHIYTAKLVDLQVGCRAVGWIGYWATGRGGIRAGSWLGAWALLCIVFLCGTQLAYNPPLGKLGSTLTAPRRRPLAWPYDTSTDMHC